MTTDEIRERLSESKEVARVLGGPMLQRDLDIAYLLARVEKLERALDEIASDAAATWIADKARDAIDEATEATDADL